MGRAGLLMLLPAALAPLLLVFAGLATVIGAKGFARTLAITVAAMVFAPAVLAPLFAAIPTWMLLMSIPILGFTVAGSIVSGVFGRRVWEEVLGRWLSRFLMPLWALGTLLVLLLVLL